MTGSRATRTLAVVVLTAAAVAGLWLASRPRPAGPDASVAEVTAGLRCPTCEGQSVAASESDLARQMRLVTAQQLAAGRTPAQIRAWFAERYGDGVLLDPPPAGAGLAARLVPFGLLGVGGVVVARQVRGRRGLFLGAGLATGLAVVLVATGGLGTGSVSPGSWTPPVEASSPAASAEAPPSPTGGSAAVGSSHLALAALQAGRADEAEQLARRALASAPRGSREWQDALLVVGLAQRQRGDPTAARTLLDFLAAAPDHPAAAMVRRLLDAG